MFLLDRRAVVSGVRNSCGLQTGCYIWQTADQALFLPILGVFDSVKDCFGRFSLHVGAPSTRRCCFRATRTLELCGRFSTLTQGRPADLAKFLPEEFLLHVSTAVTWVSFPVVFRRKLESAKQTVCLLGAVVAVENLGHLIPGLHKTKANKPLVHHQVLEGRVALALALAAHRLHGLGTLQSKDSLRLSLP